MARALLVSLVPLGALAAFGGAYSTATLPILAASVVVFLTTGARVASTPDTRTIDLALAAAIGLMVVQVLPLPEAVVATLSPHAATIQNMLALVPAGGTRPLSVEARLTREGIATASAAVLLYWAARHTFARGGVRIFTRAIAWAGLAAALVALAQRATAPTLLLWRWKPLDPGAMPYGPFVNRNHFAMWLLMASGVTAGYLVTRLRSHGFEQHRSSRLLARDVLADGNALLLTGALAAMLLALVGSLSRASLLGLAAALVFGAARGRRAGKDPSIVIASGMMLVLVAGTLWINREGLAGRLETTEGPGRLTIWRETMPLIADFWPTGTGIGTYGTAMLHYQVSRRDTLFNQAHNEYLQLVAEGGVLMAIAAGIAAWAWLRAARGRLAGEGHGLYWIRLGAAAAICGAAVQSVFEGGLRMPANALMLAVLAAIVTHGGGGDETGSRSARAQPARHAAD